MFAVNEQPGELTNHQKSKTPLGRIGHMHVHFKNERLSDVLHSNLIELDSHKYKQSMKLNSQIDEIRRTLQDYKIIQKCQRGNKSGQPRPQTSSAYPCRRVITNPLSNAPVVNKHPEIPSVRIIENGSSDDDSFRKPRTKSAPGTKHKGSLISIASSESINGIRSQTFLTQPNKRSKTSYSKLSAFQKESLNRMPTSSVVTSSTLDITDGGQSASTSNAREGRFNLICERTSKIRSRRQLIEMTNINRLSEEQKRTNVHQVLKETHTIHVQNLDNRVKVFIESLEKLKKKSLE